MKGHSRSLLVKCASAVSVGLHVDTVAVDGDHVTCVRRDGLEGCEGGAVVGAR